MNSWSERRDELASQYGADRFGYPVPRVIDAFSDGYDQGRRDAAEQVAGLVEALEQFEHEFMKRYFPGDNWAPSAAAVGRAYENYKAQSTGEK